MKDPVKINIHFLQTIPHSTFLWCNNEILSTNPDLLSLVLICFILLVFYVRFKAVNYVKRTYYKMHVWLTLIRPWYPHTNSPHWSSYIALKNKLREFDKRLKHFSLADHFIYSHKLFFYYASILLRENWCWSLLALNSRI